MAVIGIGRRTQDNRSVAVELVRCHAQVEKLLQQAGRYGLKSAAGEDEDEAAGDDERRVQAAGNWTKRLE